MWLSFVFINDIFDGHQLIILMWLWHLRSNFKTLPIHRSPVLSQSFIILPHSANLFSLAFYSKVTHNSHLQGQGYNAATLMLTNARNTVKAFALSCRYLELSPDKPRNRGICYKSFSNVVPYSLAAALHWCHFSLYLCTCYFLYLELFVLY